MDSASPSPVRPDLTGESVPLGFSTELRRVFREWEKLRLVYVTVLTGAVLWLVGPQGLSRPSLVWLLIRGAVAANFLYLAGPAVESCAVWLGFRSRWLRGGLFAVGTLLSLVVMAGALFGELLPDQE